MENCLLSCVSKCVGKELGSGRTVAVGQVGRFSLLPLSPPFLSFPLCSKNNIEHMIYEVQTGSREQNILFSLSWHRGIGLTFGQLFSSLVRAWYAGRPSAITFPGRMWIYSSDESMWIDPFDESISDLLVYPDRYHILPANIFLGQGFLG